MGDGLTRTTEQFGVIIIHYIYIKIFFFGQVQLGKELKMHIYLCYSGLTDLYITKVVGIDRDLVMENRLYKKRRIYDRVYRLRKRREVRIWLFGKIKEQL